LRPRAAAPRPRSRSARRDHDGRLAGEVRSSRTSRTFWHVQRSFRSCASSILLRRCTRRAPASSVSSWNMLRATAFSSAVRLACRRAGLPRAAPARIGCRRPASSAIASLSPRFARLLQPITRFSTAVEVREHQLGRRPSRCRERDRRCPRRGVMSTPSKQRSTCTIASTSRMWRGTCCRGLRPSTPRARDRRCRRTRAAWDFLRSSRSCRSDQLARRGSGTVDTADVRVDRAERVVRRLRRRRRRDRALKSVDLPTLGSPTMPH
jgi:hypothetical protein